MPVTRRGDMPVTLSRDEELPTEETGHPGTTNRKAQGQPPTPSFSPGNLGAKVPVPCGNPVTLVPHRGTKPSAIEPLPTPTGQRSPPEEFRLHRPPPQALKGHDTVAQGIVLGRDTVAQGIVRGLNRDSTGQHAPLRR